MASHVDSHVPQLTMSTWFRELDVADRTVAHFTTYQTSGGVDISVCGRKTALSTNRHERREASRAAVCVYCRDWVLRYRPNGQQWRLLTLRVKAPELRANA